MWAVVLWPKKKIFALRFYRIAKADHISNLTPMIGLEG
jgi:hypothetical protein